MPLLADLTPLRVSPAYRRLWLGFLLSGIGQQMTAVAVAIQVFRITGSSLAVGLVGGVSLVPLVVFGLYGGAIADAMDRRRLMLISSVGLAACSAGFTALALVGVAQVWPLYLLVALQSACYAVNNPARSASIPRLVGTDLLPAANALSQLTMGVSFTLGPLLAGVLLGAVPGDRGLALVYGLDVLAFGAAMAGVLGLPPIHPEVRDGTAPRRAGFSSVVEGLQYLKAAPNLRMTFVVDLVAMVFGMPRALFPALAQDWFGGGPTVVGLLSAAPAVGALVAAAFSGWLGGVRWQGRAVVVAITVWGLAITVFGLVRWLPLALGLLVLAGAADAVSAVFRSTILQAAAPDELRGRLQGVFIVVVSGGPRLGDVESGAVAALAGLTFSVVSGGLLCLGGLAVAVARWPRFLRYDALHPEP